MVKYAERAPGVYPATFVALDTEYPITDRTTGEEKVMWRWVFQELADKTTVGEMDTLTTPGFRARSNGLKLFTGMLGRPPTPEDDTDTLIGQAFDVTWGPNQNGRNTITGALQRGAVVPPTLPAAATSTASDGELPF
jgi:hypothetical protein